MLFLDELKQNIAIIRDPLANTKKSMDVIDVLLFYYKATVIPLILVIIVEVLLSGVVAAVIAQLLMSIPIIGGLIAGLAGIITSALLILATIFLMWIAVPIGLISDAIMFHVFGKFIFKKFNQDFENTVSAVFFSAAPLVIFSWVILIPLLGIWLFLFLVGWKYALMLTTLSNLQKINKSTAGWVIFFTWIIIGILGVLLSLVI